MHKQQTQHFPEGAFLQLRHSMTRIIHRIRNVPLILVARDKIDFMAILQLLMGEDHNVARCLCLVTSRNTSYNNVLSLLLTSLVTSVFLLINMTFPVPS